MNRLMQMNERSKAVRRNPIVTRNLILWLFDFNMYIIIAAFVLLLRGESFATFSDRILPLAVLMACVFFSRWVFRVYLRVWRYATAHEYLIAIWADCIGGVVYLGISRLLVHWNSNIMLWQTVTIVTVNCLMLLSSRFVYLCFHNEMKRNSVFHAENGSRHKRILGVVKKCIFPVFILFPLSWRKGRKPIETADIAAHNAYTGDGKEQGAVNNKINIAIVGAGDLGVLLAQELLSNPRAHYYPYCFVDSDMQKVGNMIAGIHVYPEKGILGRLRIMPVQEVIIALPSLSGQHKKEIYELYQQSGCKVKLYDYPFSYGEKKDSKRMLREFSIEELLTGKRYSLQAGKACPLTGVKPFW